MPETDFSKYTHVSFRPGNELYALLTERTDDAPATAVKRDLWRYYDLLANSVPAFSMEEAAVLCEALNGVRCSPGTLWPNVAAAIAGSEFFSDVVYDLLLKRLKAFSPLECQAIIDAVERYWIGSYSKKAVESRAALYRVGLVKE